MKILDAPRRPPGSSPALAASGRTERNGARRPQGYYFPFNLCEDCKGARDNTSIVGKIMWYIARLLRDEEGQDLIEYAIILSFVTLSVVGLFMGAGQDVKGAWTASNNELTKANVGAS